MVLEFPGFQTLVPNEVYGKDTKVMHEGKLYRFKNVFLPSTFIHSSKDEIIYAMFDLIENIENMGESEPNSLEDKILKIPAEVRQVFKEKKESFINKTNKESLKENQDPKRFILVDYGLFPAEYLKSDEKKGINIGRNRYEELLNLPNLRLHNWGKRWEMKIYEGLLSEREKIYEAINNPEKQSNLFRISKEYSFDQVKEVVDVLSTRLLTKDELIKLKDITKWTINIRTSNMLYQLLSTLSSRIATEAAKKRNLRNISISEEEFENMAKIYQPNLDYKKTLQ